jgi:hypothetical protein
MQLSTIQNNMRQLTLKDGTQVLFSYETPVASWAEGQFYKTDKKWSNTTTRHINKWAHCAVSKPQSYFDDLIKGL